MRIIRDLSGLIILLFFIIIFGGWNGLINVGIIVWFLIGVVFTILITFFFWDFIVAVVKWVVNTFFLRKKIA